MRLLVTLLIIAMLAGCKDPDRRTASERYICPEGMVLQGARKGVSEWWWCIPGSPVTPVPAMRGK